METAIVVLRVRAPTSKRLAIRMKKAAPEGTALSSVGRVPDVLVYRHMRSTTQLAPVTVSVP